METLASSCCGTGLLASSLTYWFWSSPKADFQNQELAAEVEDTPLPEHVPSAMEEQIADAERPEIHRSQPSALSSSVRLLEVLPDTLHEGIADLPLEAVSSEENRQINEPAENGSRLKRRCGQSRNIPDNYRRNGEQTGNGWSRMLWR